MRVGAQLRIVVHRTKCQRCTTAPSSHHFRREQFLVVRVCRVRLQVSPEFRDALMKLAENNVRAVATQKLGLHFLDGTRLIGITNDELAGFERLLLRIRSRNSTSFNCRMAYAIAESKRFFLR